MRRSFLFYLALLSILVCGLPQARAQQIGAVAGKVYDSSHAVVPNAAVTLTNTAGGSPLMATSDATGQFRFPSVVAGAYTLAVSSPGFAPFHQEHLQVRADKPLSLDIQLAVSSTGESVVVYGGVINGVTSQPTQQQIFESSQSVRVLDRKQMEAVGPVAGAAQILSLTPGANINGYGNTGATKYTITLNGINQGWTGYGGYTGAGSLAITFDGIPIADPATDLWEADTLPVPQLIQNTSVTYGPGDPANRWFNNIGGSVEFTPLQPTAKPHASLGVTYGSYNQKSTALTLSSGLYHGWSTVIGGGVGSGDDFRISPDGFKNPSKDLAVYNKTVKSFGDNSFEFGGYYGHSAGYRSQVIPLKANPYITTTGIPFQGQEYSQQTSGFYSSLPFASYNKYDSNDMALVYARETLRLDPTTTLQNLSWFNRIDRTHYRTDDVYSLGPQEREWNSPHTNTIGDRVSFNKTLPWNTVTGDAYYIHALYNTRNNFYNPADGGSKTVANAGGKVRSSYFDQDDFALSLQDDIHPWSILHITPGVRYVGFTANFADEAQQDFALADGAVWDTACRYNGQGQSYSNGVDDQGSCPAARENRSGVEPSINANLRALPWLELYGGYSEALRAPELGGGGGLFQAVDPVSYHLERGKYAQGGFKIHPQGDRFGKDLLFGAAYFHTTFANQEIDTTNEAGDTIDADGTSVYHGVNLFLDDDPLPHLHTFVNASFEGSKYTTYVVGGENINGTNTCYGPTGFISGCVSYNGTPVSYVPNTTFNIGGSYDWLARPGLHIQPLLFYQYEGTQHIFSDVTGAPTNQTMATYGTLNAAVTVPFHHYDLAFHASNITNRRYDGFEIVSAGSYFGTATSAPAGSPYANGYTFGYPGSPFVAYGSFNVHF